MPTTFQLNSILTSGPYAGDYNWNTGLNWDSGTIPASGANLVLPTLSAAYTSVDDIPSINGINLSIGDSVTLIIAAGDTDVQNINQFGTNSLFRTDGSSTVSIANGLGGSYAVNGPTASLDITGFNGIGTFNLFSGALTFENNANLSAGNAFDFEGDSSGNLEIANQNNYQNGWSFPVTDFAVLDTITFGTSFFAAGTYTNAYDAVDHTLTIAKSAGGNYVFNNFSMATGAPTTFQVTDTPTTSTIEAVCYARGTMIQTPAGERPVETLHPGMQVITLVDRQETPRTVKWVGYRRIDLTRHPRSETVAPIRIERHAFANNVPHRDLLLSPDHAILFDGTLFCVRQLVNGSTIRRECGWTAVDYYHVELDRHAILLAEGLTVESYLDTGNRAFFVNSGMHPTLHPDLPNESKYPTRASGSCAPFLSVEAGVRPVWQRLVDRAAAIGRAAPVGVTTTDASPRIQCPGGGTIEPIYRDSVRAIFVLPPAASEVRLISRAQAPTEARPWLEDRRRLGVRVKRIVLRDADDMREIAMDHPDFARGWWDIEHDGPITSRWTDGAAVLPLPPMPRPVLLEIHLAGAMTYAEDALPAGGTEYRVA